MMKQHGFGWKCDIPSLVPMAQSMDEPEVSDPQKTAFDMTRQQLERRDDLGAGRRVAVTVGSREIGGLVRIKQDDLVKALKERRILGAGLDVFDPEPPKSGDPDLGLPEVILSPHFAGGTYEVKQRVSKSLANEALRALNGNLPRFLDSQNFFKAKRLLSKWAQV
jgi:D-isomer specific 2-hydroxyacid dehydrogenase, NAD binding domain